MATLTETVYLTYDNPIVLQLTSNASAADLSGVTRMVLDCGTLEIDSNTSPAEVAWAGSNVTLVLGRVAGLAVLSSPVTARLIVYSPSAPHGLLWIEKLKLKLTPAV
jgi:hypothetical protein